MQLEAVVAALAPLPSMTRCIGGLERRVDLVGALEDGVDARHLEVVGRDLAVEARLVSSVDCIVIVALAEPCPPPLLAYCVKMETSSTRCSTPKTASSHGKP